MNAEWHVCFLVQAA